MSSVFRMMPAAPVVLASCLVAPVASFTATAQVPQARSVEGSWAGAPFGLGEWIFEFKRHDGGWSGRYMDVKFNKWHDLQSLTVSDDAVAFDLPSRPVVHFELQVDPSGRVLSGTTNLGGRLTRPFSAVRRS